MRTQVRVNGSTLDVCASNAAAFMPALSQVQVARLRVEPDRVEITATDTYTAARDSCQAYDMLGEPVSVLIPRDTLLLLAKIGRQDKKSHGILTIEWGVGIGWEPAGGSTPFTAPDASVNNSQAWEMYAAVDDMLGEEQPFRTAFQPQLLTRFGKVSADKSERVADIAIEDPEAPVLVKIGTTFRGLIMPVTRDVHAENVGEEGLW